jgi:hypothetical protein
LFIFDTRAPRDHYLMQRNHTAHVWTNDMNRVLADIERQS